MQLKGILAAAAALSMAASPALAAPVSSVSSLSVAKSVRASAKSTKASGFAFTTEIFEVLVAIGILTATVLVISDNGTDSPRSP